MGSGDLSFSRARQDARPQRLLHVLDAESAEAWTFSNASSSSQASFTSTWSGSFVTPRTARTRSTSSPSPPPSFSFKRWKRSPTRSVRSRHVVGIAEPDRPGRRRARAAQAEKPPDRDSRELAAHSCRAMSTAALAACSPGRAASRSSISSRANGSSPSRDSAADRNVDADAALSP